jgi:hypothetical protein
MEAVANAVSRLTPTTPPAPDFACAYLVTGLGAHARSIAPLDYDAHTSSAGGAPA